MARIAVVDDSKLARAFAAAALSKTGHRVILIEPKSLQLTLGELVKWAPDLILLDCSMPAFQGPSLVRACFELPGLSLVKVIILTAFQDKAIAQRMTKLGVDRVLYKPISPRDLSEAVEEAVARPPRCE
ncbi:MAG TPA: response regulator [Geothrix sp.]|nr:response regulator [Geothrix sp.]HEX4844844.1 response regulator [Geothrix sp.]